MIKSTEKSSVKWLAIVGTREINREVLLFARRKIRQKLRENFSVVSGGSTGIDHEAARMTYNFADRKNDNLNEKLKIFLPQEFNLYLKNWHKRIKAGKVKSDDVAKMSQLLGKIYKKSPNVFIENSQFDELNSEAFLFRDKQIAEFCDEMLCFRVNKSPGTTFTADVAKSLGKKVEMFDFDIR